MWHSGMRARCVKGFTYIADSRSIPLPNPGSIYTVTGTHFSPAGELFTMTWQRSVEDTLYLVFAEMPGNVVYDSAHFRPVIPRKTNIDIFRKLLNSTSITITD